MSTESTLSVDIPSDLMTAGRCHDRQWHNLDDTNVVSVSVTTESNTSLGGRVTLGIGGTIVLLLGVASVAYVVTYPSAAGIELYGASAVFSVVGIIAVLAAVYNPDALNIGERMRPSKAEMRERRVEDTIENE
jgi:hypothetical protein